MIKTYKELLEDYKNYSNPKTKISRLVKSHKIFKVAPNVYEDDKLIDMYYYALVISNPSYISFDYALYYYQMIPERAVNVTCASYKKHKTKIFKGTYCSYFYQDIPERVYSKDVLLNIDNPNYPFYMASKEKALLDKLYTIKTVKSVKNIKELLFSDLRINEHIFYSLDVKKMIDIAKLYKTVTLKMFIKYLEGEIKHGRFIH